MVHALLCKLVVFNVCTEPVRDASKSSEKKSCKLLTFKTSNVIDEYVPSAALPNDFCLICHWFEKFENFFIIALDTNLIFKI